jgi:hypothetical protein
MLEASLRNRRKIGPLKATASGTTLLKVTISIAIAGVLVLGFTYAAWRLSAWAWPEEDTGTSSGQASNGGMDMYQDDLSMLDSSLQLDVVLPFLAEHRQASIDAINAIPNHGLVNPDNYSGDKRNAQLILNNVAADLWTADTQDNTLLGKNLVSGVYANSPDTPYPAVGAQIARGHGTGYLEVHTLDAVSATFSKGVIAIPRQQPITITSETMLINSIDNSDVAVYNSYVEIERSENGKFEAPIIISEVKCGSPGFVDGSRIADWQPQLS